MGYRTFAFDFSGVITGYEGPFVSEQKYGEIQPNPEVVKAIKELLEKGHKIIIHSTLPTSIILDYCTRYKIPFTYINENPEFKNGNPGKPVATVYIDDRAHNYHGQSASELVQELENFQPFYKKKNS